MKIDMESAVKAVKALLLGLIGDWVPAERLALFKAVSSVIADSIKILENGVVRDIKPVNHSRVEKTIATITSPEPVINYQGANVDGRLAMLQSEPMTTIKVQPNPNRAPITVTTVTRKVNGEEKRTEADTGVPKLRKRPFFPGMAKDGLLSYNYYIDNRKVAYGVFTHEILKVLNLGEKEKAKYQEWGYSVPKKMIRNGECKEWSRALQGRTFAVKVDPKSVN